MGRHCMRLLVLLGTLSGLCFAWISTGQGELVERIVAIVNDDAITLSELNEAVTPYMAEIRRSYQNQEQERQMGFKVRQEVLDRMIDQRLAEQESKRLGVSVTDGEVEQRIEQIKTANFFTDEELRQALEKQGYTLEEYRQRVKEQILSLKLINLEVKSKIAITEDEIRNYYEEHAELYGGKRKVRLRAILVRVPSWDDPAARAAALRKTETVMAQLEAGVPFDTVARQHSEDTSAQNGGDLGFFAIDELTEELQETVRWMKEGEVSPVLQTPQGFQILLLEEMEGASQKALKDVRIEIQEKMYRELVEQKYQAWLEALRKRSYIRVIQ